MKKIICASILTAIMLGSLTGCGNSSSDKSSSESKSSEVDVQSELSDADTDSKAESSKTDTDSQAEADVPTELSNNGLWDCEMLVNGKVLKMPITSKTLSDLGYKAAESDKYNGEISPGTTYKFVFKSIDSDTGIILLPGSMVNKGDKELDYYEEYGTEDFVFYEMMFSGLENEGTDYSFEFTNGITIGSSPEDIVNAFGEPDYITSYDAYVYFETPDTVTDKKAFDTKESGFVRFNFRDNAVTAVTVGAKQD
ncbi:MAG: hypothetical protein PUB66_05820 [Oscillospiraceae bacterium]|nr:hypothetical protein [Oscillospiraceae bacterium]